jgi:hypothetical protein
MELEAKKTSKDASLQSILGKSQPGKWVYGEVVGPSINSGVINNVPTWIRYHDM